MKFLKIYSLWCLLCLLAAITFSKLYWGYFFSPPQPLFDERDFKQIQLQEKIAFSHQNGRFIITPRKDFILPGQANQPSRFAAELERYLNSDVPILGAFKGNWYFVNLSVGSAAPDQRLLHIVLTGQHTDDHYGRLEFLAPLSDQGIADLTTAQTQYYEYDVAGIEGLHWGLMIALMILGPISSFIMNSVKPSGQKQPCSHDTFWAPLLFHFSHCMTPCDD